VEVVCKGDSALHAQFSKEAEALLPGQSGLLALDWNNGNRTILVDQRLTGLLVGQTLRTTRAEIYRALIEATAFGARAILERLEQYGVPVKTVVCAGGIAEKNPLLMQIYADATGREMRVARSAQACALGAAVAAAVMAGPVVGGYADYPSAQRAMTGLKDVIYKPTRSARATYNKLYKLYLKLHDQFGGVRSGSLGAVMKKLLEIKEAAGR
jgi:L-ribulokinase